MKRLLTMLCVAVVIFTAIPVLASLRGLGNIEKVGLTDNDPHHLAIVLSESTMSALISDNAGTTWRAAKEEELPLALQPLPEHGDLCYRIAGQVLICSTNSGETWQNVSPWPFLRQTLNDKVRLEKDVYKMRYGHWFPDADGLDKWLVSYIVSSLFMVIAVGFIIARRGRPWVAVLLLSLATYAVIGIALLELDKLIIKGCWETLELQYGHYCPVMYPLWPLGFFLQLAGNPRLAPLVCLICFPLTPIFAGLRPDSRGLSWKLWLLWVEVACLFVILVPIAMYYGRGWIAAESLDQVLK